MNILVVGGGGREHAIIQKLKEDPRVTHIYALPGSGGIAADAVCLGGSATDIPAAVEAAKRCAADFVVVAPDDPLVLGMVDAMEAEGFPCFGPRKNAAVIEGSKAFAKDLMRRYGIPTAAYETFTDMAQALAYVDACPLPAVVKADGLALGKGVLICETRDAAREAVRSMMEGRLFGESGATVVVESFLTGPEVSVLSFTDGETIVPMVSSMDHKRALDGDKGLNTGGMGAVAPNPCYTPEIAAACMEQIFLPTIRAMKAEGRPFKGCLYFGLMLTPDGPKVIEYNCRFGDPETQVVLPLLESSLLEIMLAVWAAGEPVQSTYVQEKLRGGRDWALPAVITALNRLGDKGYLACEKKGRGNLYRALIGEEEYKAAEGRGILDRLYGGSFTGMVASLCNGKAIGKDDLAELRQYLDALEDE